MTHRRNPARAPAPSAGPPSHWIPAVGIAFFISGVGALVAGAVVGIWIVVAHLNYVQIDTAGHIASAQATWPERTSICARGAKSTGAS